MLIVSLWINRGNNVVKEMVNNNASFRGNVPNLNNVPVGVKIISVFEFIGSAAIFILGLLMVFGAGFISDLAKDIPGLAGFGAISTGLFVFAGIVLLLFAVLFFFVGKGLWMGQNWARIVVIVFSCLGILGSLSPFKIVTLVIHLVIGGYLLFAPEVKEAFA